MLTLPQVVGCFKRKRKKNIVIVEKIQVHVPSEAAEREPDYHINSSVRYKSVCVFISILNCASGHVAPVWVFCLYYLECVSIRNDRGTVKRKRIPPSSLFTNIEKRED